MFFIIMQKIKVIFTRKVCTWTRFNSEGFWNSEMAFYERSFTVLHVEQNEDFGKKALSTDYFWKLDGTDKDVRYHKTLYLLIYMIVDVF